MENILFFSLTRLFANIMMKLINRMDAKPVMTLAPEIFRSAMRAWSAGVTVLTVVHGEDRHGMTVNSFTSISLEPATIGVTIQMSTRAWDLVMRSRTFGVTVLAADQEDISDLFAGRKPEVIDRLAAVQTEALITGSPFIVGGLAWFDCQVTQTYDVGASTHVIAEVVAAREFGGSPLIYHNREYWHLSKMK